MEKKLQRKRQEKKRNVKKYSSRPGIDLSELFLRIEDFLIFARTIGLQDRATEKIVKKICTLQDKFLMQCDTSYLTAEKKEQVKELICKRISIINDVKCVLRN